MSVPVQNGLTGEWLRQKVDFEFLQNEDLISIGQNELWQFKEKGDASIPVPCQIFGRC